MTPQGCSSLSKHQLSKQREQHRAPTSKRVVASLRTLIKESTHRDLGATKPRLSPLAARAALASRIQWLSSGLLKPYDGGSLGNNTLEELDSERHIVLTFKSYLPTASSTGMNETTSKSKASSVKTCEEPSKSQVISIPGSKNEVSALKPFENSLTTKRDFAAVTKFDNASAINSKVCCTSEKDLSSLKRPALAMDMVEQSTVEVSMLSQGHFCKKAEPHSDSGPAATDITLVSNAAKHESCLKAKRKRPRKITATQTEKRLEEKPSAAKRSRQLIIPHTNASAESSLAHQKRHFDSETNQQNASAEGSLQNRTEAVQCRIKPAPNCSSRSLNCEVAQFVPKRKHCSTVEQTITKGAAQEDSADGEPSKLSSEKKKVAKLPSRISRGNMDAVERNDVLQASKPPKRGNLSLVKSKRARGSQKESHSSMLNRRAPRISSVAALEMDRCNQEPFNVKPESQHSLHEALHSHRTSVEPLKPAFDTKSRRTDQPAKSNGCAIGFLRQNGRRVTRSATSISAMPTAHKR